MNKKISFSIVLVFLSLISLLTLFSLAPQKLTSQAIFLVSGFLLYLYLANQKPDLYYNLGWASYFIVVSFLLITLLFGRTVHGSSRWIEFFNFRLQISELSKPLMIIFYAQFMQEYPPKNLKNLSLNVLLAFIPIVLIFFQPDFGTALIHLIILFSMLITFKLSTRLIISGALLTVLGILFLPQLLKPYQLQRIKTFLHPETDPLGAGYNIIQAKIAVGSGKIFGKGLGQGTQSHLQFLPEYSTDFIFAAFAEEFGLLGSIVLLGLFFYLFQSLLKFLLLQRKLSAQLILTGTFAYLFFQTSLNIAMNLGLAPITGVPLPLISSGGSSILATFISLGVAISTIKSIREKPSLELK